MWYFDKKEDYYLIKNYDHLYSKPPQLLDGTGMGQHHDIFTWVGNGGNNQKWQIINGKYNKEVRGKGNSFQLKLKNTNLCLQKIDTKYKLMECVAGRPSQILIVFHYL